MDKKLFLLAEMDNDTQNKLQEINKIILDNGLIGDQTKDIPYHISLCSFVVEQENELKKLMDDINKEKDTYGNFGFI